MENKTNIYETLLESATDYGKTSFELVKLKALDKTADVISSFIPQTVVFVLIGSFLFFISIGLALWIGKLLGNIYFGFFIVAAFYGLTAIVCNFLLKKGIKQSVYDYIIKQMFK
jgi:hypothetical protein